MTAPALQLVPDLTRLPDDPGQWRYDDAERIVRSLTPDWISTTKKFVDGDHWQSGAAWIGPQLAPSESGQTEVLQLLHAGFTSRNVVKEIAERHTNGLVGFEPAWELTLKRQLADDEEPSAEEQTLMDEAHAALTEWWDSKAVTVLFWNACYQLAWASRSPMRLYTNPRAFTESNGKRGVQQQKDLSAALKLILLDIPDPIASAVFVHPDTQEEVGIRLFDRDGAKKAELTWTDGSGNTMVRTVAGPGSRAETDTKPQSLSLAGFLTVHEMRRLRLVTDSALQLQRALNLALSVIPRTIVTAGFLERILINAKLPGEWKVVNGEKKYVPSPLTFGPATTISLMGELNTDEVTGKTFRDTPQVVYREPVAVTGTLEARAALYAAVLEECDQAHVLLNSEATPSGRSREQARADFTNSLGLSKHAIDRAGRWLIGTALALAEVLIGQPGKYTSELRVRFNTRLDPGPLSNEERAQNVSEWKEGLLSRESVLIRGGVEDPDAEIATVMGEPGAQLALSERQATVFALWQDIGASPKTAAQMANLEDDEVRQISKDLAIAGEQEEEQQQRPEEAA